MTVQELINKLEAIEDKTLQITLYDKNKTIYSYNSKELQINKKTYYFYDSNSGNRPYKQKIYELK